MEEKSQEVQLRSLVPSPCFYSDPSDSLPIRQEDPFTMTGSSDGELLTPGIKISHICRGLRCDILSSQ